jgi:tetratricopeptide (TPR) repeat protein
MNLKRFVLIAVVLLVAAAGCAKKQTAAPVVTGAQMFEEGNYDEARTYYQGVLDEDSTDVDALTYMTRIALRQDDYNAAIGWVDRALELAPDSSNVHYWAATAYVVKLQSEQAFELVGKVRSEIDKAVELDPTNVDARLFLAGFLLNAPPIAGGSVDRAKEQADIVVQHDPFRGQLFWAQIYQKEKKFEEAAQAYEAAAEADPKNAAPHYRLGLMYQSNERYDEAFAAFERAFDVDPEATYALYQIGRTGVMSGENIDRSIQALKKYLRTQPPPGQPTLGNAHWRLGMLYELKGDLDAARKEFEAALELNPDDENAKKSLEELGKSGE